MQLIVADTSIVARARLRRALAAHPDVTACITASDLTETYNAAEHQTPDAVVVAVGLAALEEFELLASLFKMLGIACVVLGDSAARMASPVLRRAQHLPLVPADAPVEAILTAAKTAAQNLPAQRPAKAAHPDNQGFDPQKVVLIGSSTGGINALMEVLRHFGSDCPPTFIVQHTGDRFASSLIRLLHGATEATVQAAAHGQRAQRGHVYFAPDKENHICLRPDQPALIQLRPGPLQTGHRPSADTLFHSATGMARHVTAALLTGMGRDGAAGLLALRQAGAHTIGQDKATSVVYGMPRIAMEMGGVAEELPLRKIGPALLKASLARVRA